MAASAPGAAQDLRFCAGADGTRLAWATHGSGPPLLIAGCWLSHLSHDWQSPVWRHLLDAVGAIATTTRFDERGFGLSDREVQDFSFDSRLTDLETIADHLPQQRFALMGISAGAPLAVAYAARHPERVSRLILYAPIGSGCFASGDPDSEAALLAIIKAGWARRDPVFRRVFTSLLIPEAGEEQRVWLDELQRVATSPENAIASRIARSLVDVEAELPRVQAPTLVLHAREDRAAPFGYGRHAASVIPDARLVALESANHILLGDEPSWVIWLDELTRFLEPERPAPDDAAPPLELSAREREILALAARGLDNAQIAAALVLSARTVERHLQNIYGRAGLAGRAARTAAVARFLTHA